MMQQSMLDKTVHAPIIADINHICAVAQIIEKYVHEPLANNCGPKEVEFVKKMPLQKPLGLVYYGDIPDVHQRMSAIVGALIRNFIDGRMMTLKQFIDESSDSTVLAIPNFFLRKECGGYIPDWMLNKLYDHMVSRLSTGMISIVYVQDKHECAKTYGKPFTDLLANFVPLTQGE